MDNEDLKNCKAMESKPKTKLDFYDLLPALTKIGLPHKPDVSTDADGLLKAMLDNYAKDSEVQAGIDAMNKQANNMVKIWHKQVDNIIDEFVKADIRLANAMQNYHYSQSIADYIRKYPNIEIVTIEPSAAADIGISYKAASQTFEGTATQNGEFSWDIEFRIKFKLTTDKTHKKTIKLIINPDPKDLWEDKPSNQAEPFAKKDAASAAGAVANKKFIAASIRGRSHANHGLARDDDFVCHQFADSGWSLFAVADGAGSAKFSREGSRVSCESIVKYIATEDVTYLQQLDELLAQYLTENAASLGAEIKKSLYKITLHVHNVLRDTANNAPAEYAEKFAVNKPRISYFHSTLAFVLLKYFSGVGYVLLSFSVGDCPIGVLCADSCRLLNKLDVGEYGGGTRFITEADIFDGGQNIAMAERFQINVFADFNYLFLMTDGVYDAKFEVEANLDKLEKWQEFVKDLQGGNPESINIDFAGEAQAASANLVEWLKFWSKGNHDDRTLLIVY